MNARWAMAAVHGQECWACGAGTSLDEAEIVPVVPVALAGDAEALAALSLEPEFDVDGVRNRALACQACAGEHEARAGDCVPEAIARKNLDRAARRAAMVRRAEREAVFSPAVAGSLVALVARPDALTREDVAALATTWAGFQARKIAHVRGSDTAYDFVRDSFAKTTIWWKPPPPLRLSGDVALVFEDMLAERLAGLRWSLASGPLPSG